MHRVMKRTWIMGIFLLVLLGGMVFFLWEYATDAPEWVGYPRSPHGLQNGLGRGAVYDSDGEVLMTLDGGKHYSSDAETRKSTLHWLGDLSGSIRAPAISNYRSSMSGYDLVNGIYNYSEGSGEIHLTLSSRVQNAAYRAMNGRKGTVAVYNYKTGEILCAVTGPTFDPANVPDIEGDTTGAYEGVYLNRFVQSTYIPGSIFKVVTTAAALDCVDGIEDMTFTCQGVLPYGDQKVSCEKVHGTLDLKGALAHSCNCCFAQIAELVGRKNMEKYVKEFGLLDAISFDGITTAAGSYDISDAAPVSFAWSCIGQYTDLVNPCNFMTFMGAIAGDGQAAKPFIESRVTDGTDTTYEAKTEKTGRILSREVAETVQSYMRGAVEQIYGAGNFPGLTVCAKSGTCQLGGGKTYNAMFAGFVADEDYPLAFIVVLENAGYGASACVPVLRPVLAECKAVLDGR